MGEHEQEQLSLEFDARVRLEFVGSRIALRRLALRKEMTRWTLTSLRERLMKIGARLVRHARRLILQMAEVGIPRDLFGQILSRIRLLSPIPTRGTHCVAVIAEKPVVFTDTGLRSCLLSVCRAACGPPQRHECRQKRVRRGFATWE